MLNATRALGAALLVSVALLVPASAGASDKIGDAYPASGSGGQYCGNFGGTIIQAQSAGGSYAAPYDGVLTSWGSRGRFPTVTLKVARMGIGSAFTMIATDGRPLST